VALTHAGAGRFEEARQALNRAESAASAGSRQSLTDPIAHAWIDACVRHATGDLEGAKATLRAAEDLRLLRREAIADPLLRQSYDALPLHRAVAAALGGRWPGARQPCLIAYAVPERRGDAGVLR
jgi:hypothetical protein